MADPIIIKEEDVNPNYNWHKPVGAPGHMNVDYEQRIDFTRLH